MKKILLILAIIPLLLSGQYSAPDSVYDDNMKIRDLEFGDSAYLFQLKFNAVLHHINDSTVDSDTLQHYTPTTVMNDSLDSLRTEINTKTSFTNSDETDQVYVGDSSNLLRTNDTTGLHHSNRSSLDLVSGTNTGDQDMNGYVQYTDTTGTGKKIATNYDIDTIQENIDNIELGAISWDTLSNYLMKVDTNYFTNDDEADPIYSASIASGITGTDTANWNAAVGATEEAVISAMVNDNLTFTGSLTFSKKWNFYNNYITSGNIEVTPITSGKTKGAATEFQLITGNSGDTVSWSSEWTSRSVYEWDTAVNTIHHGQAWSQGARYYYNIYDKYVLDVNAPDTVSAVVTNNAPDSLVIVFSENIQASTGTDTTGITIIGYGDITVDSVSYSGKYLTAYLSDSVTADSSYTYNYEDSIGDIRDLSDNALADITNGYIDNQYSAGFDEYIAAYLTPYQLFIFNEYGWSDEQSISSVQDLSGNGRNASDGICTEPKADQRTIGASTVISLNFDESNGLDLGHTGSDFYGDDFTVMIAFEMVDGIQTTSNNIFGAIQTSPSMIIQASAVSTNGNNIVQVQNIQANSSQFNNGAVAHAVQIYKFAFSSDSLSIYKDGSLIDYRDISSINPATINLPYNLFLGNRNTDGAVQSTWSGRDIWISHFAIWDRKLTDSEMTTIFNQANIE